MSEKICFECALECLSGWLLSDVIREGIPMCWCSVLERAFTICFGASAWNREKEVVV